MTTFALFLASSVSFLLYSCLFCYLASLSQLLVGFSVFAMSESLQKKLRVGDDEKEAMNLALFMFNLDPREADCDCNSLPTKDGELMRDLVHLAKLNLGDMNREYLISPSSIKLQFDALLVQSRGPELATLASRTPSGKAHPYQGSSRQKAVTIKRNEKANREAEDEEKKQVE